MARLNVYVPDDLHDRLMAHGIGGPATKGGRAVNVSALLREPLERALAGEESPHRPTAAVGFNLRLPRNLHQALTSLASANGRSLQKEIVDALRVYAGTPAVEPPVEPSLICPCPRCSPPEPEPEGGLR